MIVLFGTRPEAIKLGPVVAELRALGVKPQIICTGQHTDLLRGTPAETDLSDCVSLRLASDGDVERWVETAVGVLRPIFREALASSVVVQGDTMSALAGARAGKAEGLVVCHVEAGVRSHNLDEPWPEEAFRVEIDRLAGWMYAPTSTAYANLVAEGRRPQRIRVTGNSGVSAIARYTEAKPVSTPGNRIWITLHRREWLRSKLCRSTILEICAQAARRPEIEYAWPVHPAVRPYMSDLPRHTNLVLVNPMAYANTVEALARSMGVITDSGGLQEEAATLGVPCAVLRNVTDRPESIQAGVAELFPPTPEGVRKAFRALDPVNEGLVGARIPTNAYGHPDAALQIAQHLASI